jgi:hypothetical protein
VTVFERFTEGARQVVVLAQEESRLLGHNHIGTEHVLLGVLRQEDDALNAVLAAHGVTLEPARVRVVEITGRGEETGSGQIPFTAGAKKVLELSLRECQGLRHNAITPLHITLALIREGEGVAALILSEHDVDPAGLEQLLIAEYPPAGPDIYRTRIAVIEARLAAWERRAELIEIAATAPDGGQAEVLVAERLALTREQARNVLNMRLEHFTAASVDGFRAELDALRARLED